MTTQLQLEPEEVEALRDLLNAAISDLSPEIADTDNPEYRRGLKPDARSSAGSSHGSRDVARLTAPPSRRAVPPSAHPTRTSASYASRSSVRVSAS